MVFQRIAEFGAPDLNLENLALLAGEDEEDAKIYLERLRRFGLVKPETLEIDLDAFVKIEAIAD
jgi:hypothetical protein